MATRVTDKDYDKAISRPGHRLPGSDGSGPVTNLTLNNEMISIFYDQNLNELPVDAAGLQAAVLRHQRQATVEYYYVRINKANELLDTHNKLHMQEFTRGKFGTWVKVSRETYEYYCHYLKSGLIQSYTLAKQGLL